MFELMNKIRSKLTDEEIKVAKEFNRKLHSINDKQTEDPNMETTNIEVSCVNSREILKKHLDE